MPAREGAAERQIRVLLVEDHPLMVEGLKTRLTHGTGMVVSAVAANTRQLLAQYPSSDSDVVLCDVSLAAGDNGIDATRQLLRAHPEAAVLMYSADTSIAAPQASIEAGAAGFLLKSTSAANLVECIRAAADGERDIFDRATAKALLKDALGGANSPEDGPLARLTGRQIQIMRHMAETGQTSTATIARALFISPATVRTHFARMFEALNVNSRAAVIHVAYTSGLVDPTRPETGTEGATWGSSHH